MHLCCNSLIMRLMKKKKTYKYLCLYILSQKYLAYHIKLSAKIVCQCFTDILADVNKFLSTSRRVLNLNLSAVCKI